MNIKEVWQVFKHSDPYDMDMQRVFRRAATPNACIELLKEIESLELKVKYLNEQEQQK